MPSVFFNVSHSGNYVFCGVSNTEIGVDIEKHHLMDLDLAQHIFSPEEYKQLVLLTGREQADYFFKLWTLKEAYIKYLGMGLSMSLQSFFFTIHDGSIQLHTNQQDTLYFLSTHLQKHYSLACCANEPIEANAIEQVSLQTIVSFFSNWKA
nr:4'-phosphopantetheinyl transferase superfamily protein [Lysinibacillus macroides]